MQPIKIILNPVAGRGRGSRVEADLRHQLQEHGLEYDLVRTEGTWHAADLAEQAARGGFEIVVAAGGDGTCHEVVNGLMAAAGDGQAGTLGIIPIGSGCDFSYTAQIPSGLDEACHKLAHGQTRVFDVGRLSLDDGPARYFDNTIGIGFDGVVTVEARKVRLLRGLALYLPVVLKTVFLSLKIPLVTVTYDDQELVQRSLMVCVANGPREGGGFLVAPDAEPDDGLFDLSITREVSRLAMLGLIPHFMNGTHVDKEPVTMARAKRVTVSSPDSLVAHVDGEVLCTDGHKIECGILPQRLRVWC